jgi:hypothetical protein
MTVSGKQAPVGPVARDQPSRMISMSPEIVRNLARI